MTVLILVTGFACLVLGLNLLRQSFDKQAEQFERTNLVAWVLIALFPVLLLFSLFPGNEASGSVIGFSVGGAFAGFVLLFLLGTRRALAAKRFDDLRQEMRQCDDQVKALEIQCAAQAKRPEVLPEQRIHLYGLRDAPGKQIGLVTGSLSKVRIASIWVNSENTNMQMSRFFEETVSGIIRYLGARRDHLGTVVEDRIADELTAQLGTATSVPPGHVVVTEPGELSSTHNVKKVYHVASVQGQVGVGYRQIGDVGVCVTNGLERAQKEEWEEGEPRSIIFPLLGANVARAGLEPTVRALFTAALDHFACTPDSAIDIVYFLAFTDVERAACLAFLEDEARTAALAPT